MPRSPRVIEGGLVYHVLNRANTGVSLFDTHSDYAAFMRVLAEGLVRTPMRIISYCLMPNHWHFVLWPRGDGDVSRFMQWVTSTHTRRWHAMRGSDGGGHVYQGRFKSFPVASADGDPHYFTVCRYVERNAQRAGLVTAAEEWPWSSLHDRIAGPVEVGVVEDGPAPFWPGWCEWVNQPQNEKELVSLQRCLCRGRPFGPDQWVRTTARAP